MPMTLHSDACLRLPDRLVEGSLHPSLENPPRLW